MEILNSSTILKDSPQVLSWKEDIYLVNYIQQRETEKVNMCVHMNLISFVLQGKKEILGHSGKIRIYPGSGFFMKKGTYLVTEKIADPDKGYEAITIFFSDEWLRSQVASMFVSTTDIYGDKWNQHQGNMALLTEDSLMNKLIAELKACFTTDADRTRLQPLLPLKVLELFHVLSSAPQGHDFEMQLRSLETNVNPDLVSLMQSHFKENISLEQYAFLANCSLSTFKRKFSQAFNMNPGKWIMQRRLEEAYSLLQRSERNITEIAYEIGFETPGHFISCFKEQYGSTPKQLQQKLLKPQ